MYIAREFFRLIKGMSRQDLEQVEAEIKRRLEQDQADDVPAQLPFTGTKSTRQRRTGRK